MHQFRADLRQLDALNIRNLGTPVTGAPEEHPQSYLQESLLETTIELGSRANPGLRIFLEPIKFARHPPPKSVLLPAIVPVGLSPLLLFATGRITLGVAAELNMFLVAGITGQLGIYGNASPLQVGLFDSYGGGMWFPNIGWSMGPTVTVVFGPPSDFMGVAWGVGCDIGPPGGLTLSGSGMLLFSGSGTPTDPFRFIGFSFGVAFGGTLSAIDVTIQCTTTKPVLRFV